MVRRWSQDNRQRKHLRCFVTRIADHHALIPGSNLRYGIFLSAISSAPESSLHRPRYPGFACESGIGWKIGTDHIPLPDKTRLIILGISGSYKLVISPATMIRPLAAMTSQATLARASWGKAGVQYAVGYQIAQLVWMPFCYGFRCVKSFHGILLPIVPGRIYPSAFWEVFNSSWIRWYVCSEHFCENRPMGLLPISSGYRNFSWYLIISGSERLTNASPSIPQIKRNSPRSCHNPPAPGSGAGLKAFPRHYRLVGHQVLQGISAWICPPLSPASLSGLPGFQQAGLLCPARQILFYPLTSWIGKGFQALPDCIPYLSKRTWQPSR